MGFSKLKRASDQDPSVPLAIVLETATQVCSLALLKGDAPLVSLSFIPHGGHSIELMPAIEYLSRLSGIQPGDWNAVIVSRGPGSFTGLRIGIATAKALSLGSCIPLYGVSTLEALAYRLMCAREEHICPILNARKGQVFTALYRKNGQILETVTPPVVLDPCDIPKVAPPEAIFTGDGLDAYLKVIEEAFGSGIHTPSPEYRVPDAATVGRLGMRRLLQGQPSEIESLHPEYVRASDAELTYDRKRSWITPV